MELDRVEIRCWGRLANVEANLAPKVIALVGPNEVGKSTFLEALSLIGSSATLPISLRSRSAKCRDQQPTVSVRFALTESDLKEVGIPLDSYKKLPDFMEVTRTALDPELRIEFGPAPLRNSDPLRRALDDLILDEEEHSLETWFDFDGSGLSPDEWAQVDFEAIARNLSDAVADLISGDVESPEIRQFVADMCDQLLPAMVGGRPRDGVESIREFVLADPIEEFSPLRQSIPGFLLFGDSDRQLRGEYAIEELASPPSSLRNLLLLARLDPEFLSSVVRDSDDGAVQTAIHTANGVLKRVFEESWSQSSICVHLSLESNVRLVVRVIENDSLVSPFDERSTGLRMFIALLAFIHANKADRPPILLVDEAENHLHVDAQANLVDAFATQELAAKVIYTTHSPYCLPADLGTGIRALIPSDTGGESVLENSLWGDGRYGFSPILLAMGAASGAFSSVRAVVLAEGVTETILLPSLLRAATGQTALRYQIAPGLAEAPSDMPEQLEAVGARVVYLVDSDEGGEKKAKRLVRDGIEESRILKSGAPGVENLLNPANYRDAYLEVLGPAGVTTATDLDPPPDLVAWHESSWANQMDSWAESQGLKPPGKTAVATYMTEHGLALPGLEAEAVLRHLHSSIAELLGVDSGVDDDH